MKRTKTNNKQLEERVSALEATVRELKKQKWADCYPDYLNIPMGMPIFSPEPKSSVKLDIMPYIVTEFNHPDAIPEEDIAVPGELWYKRPYEIHRGKRTKDGEFLPVVCPKSVNGRCPICDHGKYLSKLGKPEKSLRRFATSKRNLYIVIPKHSHEFEELPHLWDVSQYLFQDLLDEELWEDKEVRSFPDLENGLTLRVRFDEGIVYGNKFAEAGRIDFEDRGYSYSKNTLSDIPDLGSMLDILSYKELEDMFL